MTGTAAADAYDRLPDAAAELFGEGATAEHAYDLLTVDVPAASWITALETARDRLGCTYFDWLSAVDEPGTGFQICAHVAALADGGVRRLLIRTTVPHDAAVLPTAVGVYAGAAWHERETHEMFGIGFEGHPHLVPLLLPEGFEGHPLRKDFVLAARVAKAWPGAKEPGESEHGGAKRRTMLPPGVPDPNEWGPLKGQLPPAPSRPARTPRAAGDRPVRRSRSASEGSASRRTGATEAAPATETAAPAATPRRSRSASEGSASRRTGPATTTPTEAAAPAADAPATPPAADADAPATTPPAGPTAPSATPRRNRSASQGSASQQRAEGDQDSAQQQGPAARRREAPRAGSSDAPWHHARPAFEPGAEQGPEPSAEPSAEPGVEPATEPGEPDGPSGESPDTSAPERSDGPEHTSPRSPKSPQSPQSENPDTPDSTAGGDTA
ncbi:NADH-quinone oxidoreductase subunit C [Streptomyces sp. NPDC001732]